MRALAATGKFDNEEEGPDCGLTDCVVNVKADSDPLASIDASVSGALTPKEKLGDCVIRLLGGYFKDYVVDGRGVKIAADARFVVGIPSIYKLPTSVGIGVAPGAITLGVYDIHFENINLTSPTWSDLRTIAEELQHGVQFIEMWQTMNDIGARTIISPRGEEFGIEPAHRPTYADAQSEWSARYLKAAADAVMDGRPSYDNAYERAAKARAMEIFNDLRLKHPQKFASGQNLCPWNCNAEVTVC